MKKEETARMKKLLTLQQAAERTSLSVSSIRQRIFDKTFPHTKIEGRLFVEESALEKFITLSQQVSPEEAIERTRELKKKPAKL